MEPQIALRRRLALHRSLNVIFALSVLCGLFLISSNSKVAFAQDKRAAITTLANNFAKGLRDQDRANLAALTESAFLDRLGSVIDNAPTPKIDSLPDSVRVLGPKTACFYLCCERDGITFLALTTCRKTDRGWVVSYSALAL